MAAGPKNMDYEYASISSFVKRPTGHLAFVLLAVIWIATVHLTVPSGFLLMLNILVPSALDVQQEMS
jgi:hypothetical protein